MAKEKNSRRSFLGIILGGSVFATLASIVYPISKYLIPPPSGEANVRQLKLPFTRSFLEAEETHAKLFKFGRTLGIIVLSDDGNLTAMAATCTHLDCTVQHRRDLGVVWCACHNGRYDLNGRNISGPPPQPLEQYTVKEVGQDIFVTREDS